MASTSSQTTATDVEPATREAIETVCAQHLHQCLWLPESSSHGELRVTFSTTSNFSNMTLPVILFCNPLFGSRWIALEFNHLARSTGVRVICVDRPGMGGSTRVPLDIRVQVWLETVPALLKRLDVEHVSLLCHSAGTIYALNTLFSLRNILDPHAPYAAFIGPWVHNEHSRATLMSLVSKIPNSMLNSLGNVSRFINQRIAPAASWSGGIVSSVSGLFQAGPVQSGSTDLGEKYGTSEEVAMQIDKLKVKYLFEEDLTGASEEVKLCLKKHGSGNWGVCEDFEKYVPDLAKQEEDSRKTDSAQPKLRVRAFFAESDMMIGKVGQKYFDQCWMQDGIGNSLDYESKELPETNHDTLLEDHRLGALKSVFEEVRSGNNDDLERLGHTPY